MFSPLRRDALPLSNGTGSGDPLGDLRFYYGTMPGADWHFVNAEGREVLTALQHRLRPRNGGQAGSEPGRTSPHGFSGRAGT